MRSVKKERIAVVGQGYVGLPLAIEAARNFKTVYGVDIDSARIQMLCQGISPIEDVSDSEIKELLVSHRYQPTTDFSSLSEVNIVVICVPTPLGDNQRPDLSALGHAVDSIKKFISPNALIISESTSFPGTLRWIVEKFSDLQQFQTLLFAVAPERINPSDSTWRMTNTPRIIGGINASSLEQAMNFYSSFCKSVFAVETPEIAEFAKLFENTFRFVNIGLVNEMLHLSNSLGIDFRKVLDAAATKPYGFMRFEPGAGVGGHCIPVDPMYLQFAFENSGVKSSYIETSRDQNEKSKSYVCDRVSEIDQSGSVLLIGVAYKANVADTRESPAQFIATELTRRGYRVLWTDSLVETWSSAEKWDGIERCDIAVNLVTHINAEYENVLDCSKVLLDTTGSLKRINLSSKDQIKKIRSL